MKYFTYNCYKHDLHVGIGKSCKKRSKQLDGFIDSFIYLIDPKKQENGVATPFTQRG